MTGFVRKYRNTRPSYRRYGVRSRRIRRTGVRRYKSKRSIIPMGMPYKYLTRLRYVEEISLTSGAAGAANTSVWRANDVFDPRYAVGGHKPLYTNELMKFYNRFTVLGAKITVKPSFNATSNVIPGMYGVALTENASDYSGWTISEVMEEEGHTQPVQVGIQSQLNTHKQGTVVKYFSAKKFFGKRLLDNDFSGTVTTSPLLQAFFVIYVVGNQSTQTGALSFLLTIEYIVKMTEPITCAQS